ncbi:unnamed protein product [Closterium sp. NIES-65]|nr:unnamed protein product [Closterium sp. NIES-65]
MHSRLLVSGLPKSLPPLPPPAPPCLPCVEERQRAAPHSSSFPPTEAPLQTLHLEVWGPARVRGQGHEWYFLLVVNDYSRYTTVFPLRRNGEVPDVSIPWIRGVRLQLCERFEMDLPVPRLHSDRCGVSQVDPVELVEEAVDSGAARGGASGGAEPAESAEPGGAEPAGVEPGGAEPERAERGGAEPGGRCAELGGPSGGLLGARASGVVVLELELLEVLEPLVPEVLVLELLGLEVLLKLLEVLVLLELELELLEILEQLELKVLLELELELLLELELVEVRVLSLLVLEVLCDRDHTSFHSFSRFLMALRPSSIPLRVPLPSPPASSLADGPDAESDSLRAASPTFTRLLATVVTDPSFESTAASALVTELVDFAARCRLDYTASLVAEQDDFECFAAAVPHLVSMLIAPEGDPDAPDILTPHSYAEAIERPYSSQWQSAMDAEMASWKSTGTYVDEVPPPGANIVSGMWFFTVKRPPGSPPVFKARYVARGFS